MSIESIRNKLIIYKNYSNLDRELVKEIQQCLLTGTKESEFEDLLRKVESFIENNL